MSAPEAKPWITEIDAYVPGKAHAADGRRLKKLSANENPLGTGMEVAKLLAHRAQSPARYPDPSSTVLRKALGERHGIDPDLIVCGTGSDELLNLAAQGYAGPGDEIIHVRYGFSVYDIATRRVGATPVVAPDHNYATDVDAILERVTDKTRVVFLANPNNPTGTLTDNDEIERLHASLPSNVLLVIDQAYAEYLPPDVASHALELAGRTQNVLVTRTFSKIYGLAAERVGWATGDAAIIGILNRIRGPFNVTATGQDAAVAALSDEEFVERSRDHNAQWREWLAIELRALSNHGIRIVPSAANFLLILFEGKVSAEEALHALAEAGYAVRHLPGQGLPNALRITIGNETANRTVAETIRQLCETGS